MTDEVFLLSQPQWRSRPFQRSREQRHLTWEAQKQAARLYAERYPGRGGYGQTGVIGLQSRELAAREAARQQCDREDELRYRQRRMPLSQAEKYAVQQRVFERHGLPVRGTHCDEDHSGGCTIQ